MIDFYYVSTGNSTKVAIMLHEVGLDYRLIKHDIFAGTHFTPEFRRINPNNKLPAIVDHDPPDGGEPLAIFESGAILLYLAEKSGRFLPVDFRRRQLAQQWLMWQMAGLGPMHGQAHHFTRYAPQDQPYALQRYRDEAWRLLNVLEYRLQQANYLAEKYSVADMACFPWVGGATLINLDIRRLPHLLAWFDRIAARPAITAAREAMNDEHRGSYLQERATLSPEQWSNMFGSRMHDASLAC